MTRTDLTFRRWFLAHFVIAFALFLIGVATFLYVAQSMDNEMAGAARRDHKWTVVKVQLGLLPAYILMATFHAVLSWPAVRRRLDRKAARHGDGRVGFLGLGLRAVAWVAILVVLSLGPITYLGPGSLDTIARMSAMAISPSLNFYVFKTWHLQEVFTAIVSLLALLALVDFSRWLAARMEDVSPRRRTIGLIGFGLLVGAPVGFAVLASGEPVRKNTDRPNIIIIGSDSLRYDHFRSHGYDRVTSPNIDAMVEESVDFENSYVATASTLESWTSFLTGKYPANHGLRYMFIGKEQADRITGDQNTLPRILKRHGYRSAVVGDWAANCFKLVDYGFDETMTSDVQNLDVFLTEVSFRSHLLVSHYFSNILGEWVVPDMKQVTGYMNPDRLITNLLDEFDDAAEEGRPFFGVAFLSCTHLPFLSTYPYNVKFVDPEYRGKNRFMVEFDVDDFIQHGFSEEHSPAVRQHVVDLYDGGVAQFDDAVGRIREYLRRTGLEKNTIFVVMSDHGEDLYDPDCTLGHGTNFFGGDQNNRIPLIMQLPDGQLGGRKVKGVTRNIDFMPTVLDLVGIDEIPRDMDGTSLTPMMSGRTEDQDLAAFAETCYLFYPKKVKGEDVYAMEPADRTLAIDPSFNNNFVLKSEYHDYVVETKDRMMRTPRWKLIYIKGKNGPIYRLFDMKEDPTQRNDLSRDGLPVFEEMRIRLEEWIKTGKDQPWPRHLDDS